MSGLFRPEVAEQRRNRLTGVQDTRDDGLADHVHRWLRRPCSVRLQGPVRAPGRQSA